MDAVMSLVDADGDGSMSYAEFVQTGKMTREVSALKSRLEGQVAILEIRIEEEAAAVHERADSISDSVQRIEAAAFSAEATFNAALMLLDGKIADEVCNLHIFMTKKMDSFEAGRTAVQVQADENAAEIMELFNREVAALKADAIQKYEEVRAHVSRESSQMTLRLDGSMRAV
eukprot:COSAG01_NODE_36292_length_519_cov_3.402381_1_plen_172_part_11